MMEDHDHEWGPVEVSRMAGNPHRKCQVGGCRSVTLDLVDDSPRQFEISTEVVVPFGLTAEGVVEWGVPHIGESGPSEDFRIYEVPDDEWTRPHGWNCETSSSDDIHEVYYAHAPAADDVVGALLGGRGARALAGLVELRDYIEGEQEPSGADQCAALYALLADLGMAVS